jgi:uncharacterized protein (TIGR03435 family)
MNGRSSTKGGPGTDDPTPFYDQDYMSTILETTLGIGNDQFANRPDWIGQERFEIVANVPSGATKEQLQEMRLNLLKDRFHFASHWTKKEIDAYTLVVAKGGPKLKPAAPRSGPPPDDPPPGKPLLITLDQDGFPQLPPGYKGSRDSSTDGTMRMTYRMSSPADLVARLGRGVFRIVDATGLNGPYDFKLEFDVESFIAAMASLNPRVLSVGPAPANSGSDPAPDIFTALEKQLGLKMEGGKIQIDAVVIDHLDRQPIEN